MKVAIVNVPKDDYTWFENLMGQNLWIYRWADDGKEFPEYEED